jgi:hypothetical protein
MRFFEAGEGPFPMKRQPLDREIVASAARPAIPRGGDPVY